MNRNSTKLFRSILPYLILIISVVILDQVVKLAVFYNMSPGTAGEISIIGDFFKLHFVQNPGMAFGINWESKYGKLILSVVRLGITVALIWYLVKSVKNESPRIFLVCLSLITGGAIGNVIDSTFYGVLLDNAIPGSLTPWMHGQVVDMFYIDIWQGRISDSVPLIGGRYLSLWPIFNVADAAVSIGVVLIIAFQGRIFKN